MYGGEVPPARSLSDGGTAWSNDDDFEPSPANQYGIKSMSSLGWALLAGDALMEGDVNRAEELLLVAYNVAEKLPRAWLGSSDAEVARAGF
jgi:hypothetical protein